MATLLVGFDSAWTGRKRGAIAGVFLHDDGTFQELGPPESATFAQAQRIIIRWQAERTLTATVIMLDQPTIVSNTTGQRPVENIVSSPVGRRYGGVQPANTSKNAMFGIGAPVWSFLAGFGGPADPLKPVVATRVFETYPVLAMIVLGWTLPDARSTGRLPKYNPERRNTFSILDWQHVCNQASSAYRARGLNNIAGRIDLATQNAAPRKSDQDCLDA